MPCLLTLLATAYSPHEKLSCPSYRSSIPLSRSTALFIVTPDPLGDVTSGGCRSPTAMA